MPCVGKKCRAWISLEDVGIPAEGCIVDPAKWLATIPVGSNHSIFDQSVYIDLPDRKMTLVKTVSHGKFGYIDEVLFETASGTESLYAKRPILAGKNLIYEACIMKLVGESLSKIGFPTGAPKLRSIFRLRDNSVCFAMEQIHNSTTLDRHILATPIQELTTTIVDCLLQLCAMIWHLDTQLGMNHRDLKPSNFLIVEHPPTKKVLCVENEILEIESRHSLTFIDFGFSCLGSTETHISNISLSTVYSKSDPCPKEGRDLFLFLAFLYIDYYQILPKRLLKLFESWLDVPGSPLIAFMKKDKESAKKWLYFMAGNQKICSFKCSPVRIVKDLQAH